MDNPDYARRLDRRIEDIRKEVGMGRGIYLDWARFSIEPKFVTAAMQTYQRFERANAINTNKLAEHAHEQIASLKGKINSLLLDGNGASYLTSSASQALSLVYTLQIASAATIAHEHHGQFGGDFPMPVALDLAQDVGRKIVNVQTMRDGFTRLYGRPKASVLVTRNILRDHGPDHFAPVSIFSGHKWLLGPKGTGVLYLPEESKEKLDMLSGVVLGVINDEDSLHSDFDLHHYTSPADFEYPKGKNFDAYYDLMYGRSTLPIAQYTGLESALDFLREVGKSLGATEGRENEIALSAIEKRIKGLTEHFTAPPTYTMEKPEPGFVLLAPEKRSSQELHEWLTENRIASTLLSAEEESNSIVRFSIHYLNTDEELHRVYQVLKRFAPLK